jgi:hypothetical protein
MPRFYEPDLSTDPNSPFVRDAANKLVHRGYWMDMDDRTLVMVMFNGIGAHLTNDEKRARERSLIMRNDLPNNVSHECYAVESME